MSGGTIQTPYGLLDRTALEDAQRTLDTRELLHMVSQLDEFLAGARAQDGLRDMLLRLHATSHTVVNGAGMAASANGADIPELATDVATEVLELVSTLRRWIPMLERLQSLAAKT